MGPGNMYFDSFQTWRAVFGVSIRFMGPWGWPWRFHAESKEPLKAQLACCNAGIIRNDASQKHDGVHFIQQPWDFLPTKNDVETPEKCIAIV